ncbi:unnamed protein product [Phytomonas sp. Hart1]|nr:unnamed protein product [Phytomonas sp. Hart1]|eukprot:CCW69200.1 unnamed protein product [Phytomonas sp. isolate Hart1]
MDQFKNGEYYWDSHSKYDFSDNENTSNLIQSAQLTTPSAPLKSPKTDAQRLRQRNERVAALLVRLKIKMPEKLHKPLFNAEEQNTTQNVPCVHKEPPLPQEWCAQVREAVFHSLADNMTSASDNKFIHQASTHRQTDVHVFSKRVPVIQHNQTETSAQYDNNSNDDQSSRELEKRLNLAANVKITLKDNYTLKVCIPWEHPNFFRVDELI